MRYFVTGGSGFLGQHLIRRLVKDGHDVLALARSDSSAATVESAGATVLRGELSEMRSLAPSIVGCDVVVHAAAYTGPWAEPSFWDEVNIEGTRESLLAAQDAKVPTFVHVSTEAVLADGKPLVKVDESHPRPAKKHGFMSAAPGTRVTIRAPRAPPSSSPLVADKPKFRVVAVRPRLIWGPDDLTILPVVIDAAKTGSWRWVDGGHYLTSTCHVFNVCEGIVLAAEKGAGGQAYFLTDGPDIEFREFITACAAALDVELPDKSVPHAVAKTAAWTIDSALANVAQEQRSAADLDGVRPRRSRDHRR